MSTENDSERRIRYGELRKRKGILEKLRGFCSYGIIFCSIPEVISCLIAGVLVGAVKGELGMFFWCLFGAFTASFSVYSLYKNRIVLLIISILFSAIAGCSGLYGMLSFAAIPILILSIVLSVLWSKLEQEEGFPHFDELFEEHQHETALREKRTRFQAEQTGVRVAADAAQPDNEMHDLLDEGFDNETAAAPLVNYHKRGDLAHPAQVLQQYKPGEMDTLEEL